MSYPNAKYADGWFGSEQELTVIPKPEFPFMRNPTTPDTYSRVYNRSYQVAPRLFLPKITRRTACTNLLTYSEDFTNAAWTKTNLTPTAAAGTAPDGNATLNKLLETVTNGEHNATQAATVSAVASELFCFAVGGLNRSWIRLAFTDSAAAVFSAFFNVDSGYAISPASNTTAIVVPLGNGQFQCILRFTPAAGAGTWKANVSTDGATISYAGDVTKGVYLWGAQVATGAVTPYVSTTTATRAVSAPDRDKTDPMAYLIDEKDPNIMNSEAATVARKFARVPLTQNVPTSLQVSKPAIAGTFPQALGNYRIFQPDTTLLKYDAYAAQTVTSDTGPVTAFVPTGGTYTAGFAGSTTAAKNYNDSNATLQTALNALTPVSNRGNCVVTGTYSTGFLVTFNSYATATAALGSLGSTTGSTVISSITSASGGYYQSVSLYAQGLDAASPAFGTGSLVYTGTAQNNYATQAGQTLDFVFSGFIVLTGGTYTLTAYGQTTAAIPYNASVATVTAAVNAALATLVARGTLQISVAQASNSLRVTIVVYPSINSGTYTVTLFGQTTAAIAYNANLAAISAAINLLSEVVNRGGCVLTGTGFGAGYFSYIGVSFSISFANPALTINPASLTPAGSTGTVAITDGGFGRTQTITFSNSTAQRTLQILNHGIVAADALYVKTDATYTLFVGSFTVPDASSIVLNLTAGSLPATATAITEAGKRTKQGYKPGTTVIRANAATLFYLPGVTVGITTPNDIPIPGNQSDDASFLTAIFAGTGNINYVVGQWVQWENGLILSQTTTQLAAADV